MVIEFLPPSEYGVRFVETISSLVLGPYMSSPLPPMVFDPYIAYIVSLPCIAQFHRKFPFKAVLSSPAIIGRVQLAPSSRRDLSFLIPIHIPFLFPLALIKTLRDLINIYQCATKKIFNSKKYRNRSQHLSKLSKKIKLTALVMWKLILFAYSSHFKLCPRNYFLREVLLST